MLEKISQKLMTTKIYVSFYIPQGIQQKIFEKTPIIDPLEDKLKR